MELKKAIIGKQIELPQRGVSLRMSFVDFSALQYLLQLSYSIDSEEQERAAVELASLVEKTDFPSVSIGPLLHALCHLIPSNNRTVSCFSMRALKFLILDDALRPQIGAGGVPGVVITALQYWEEEVLCVREILGVMQTLCWDRTYARHITTTKIISYLTDFTQASDHEVSVLALCTMANILYYADSLFASDDVCLDALCKTMPVLLQIVCVAQQRPQKFFAMAAITNAAAQRVLADTLNEYDGLEICKEQEEQSKHNIAILGSKLGECAQAAVVLLSDGRGEEHADEEGGLVGHSVLMRGSERYRFKWGRKPVMELSIASPSPEDRSQLAVALLVLSALGIWTCAPAFLAALKNFIPI
jgi:hypothetical protein